jgi:hypothetical protein
MAQGAHVVSRERRAMYQRPPVSSLHGTFFISKNYASEFNLKISQICAKVRQEFYTAVALA